MNRVIFSKLEQAYRLLYVNYFHFFFKFILVVEYPKSGGTWLSQIISEYFEIPFARNQMPLLKKSLIHGHYLPNYGIINNINPIIFLIRDGRDVMVSLYHQYLILNDKNKLNQKDIYYYRSKLKFEDYNCVKDNLPKFMEFIFTHKPSKFQHFTYMGNWNSYNQKWFSWYRYGYKNIHIIKYESMLNDTSTTISQLLKSIGEQNVKKAKLKQIIHKYSFINQSKRIPGVEDKSSFLRKGIS